MNATALKGTSRVFPPEVMAWSMIAVDEADVPRAHPNGRPDETVTALKRLKLPEMPTAVDIRLEPTLVILVYLAQSKNKTLQYFCEDNGWANIIVIDPYVRHVTTSLCSSARRDLICNTSSSGTALYPGLTKGYTWSTFIIPYPSRR